MGNQTSFGKRLEESGGGGKKRGKILKSPRKKSYPGRKGTEDFRKEDENEGEKGGLSSLPAPWGQDYGQPLGEVLKKKSLRKHNDGPTNL